ncbi:MAG: hypothetical protein FJ030_03460 [Chloroflexi bacterium]|nr:hypothetical protein [Chloroflexota bacterium]
MNFFFWQKWLFVLGLIVALFGLALAFANHTPLFDFLFNNQIDPTFWPGSVPEEAAAFRRWVYGVLGATVSGWGVFIAFIAHYPFQRKEVWAWNCIAIGMTIWFVSDTAISLYFGVGFNAMFNAALFFAALLPLLFTRKHFAP